MQIADHRLFPDLDGAAMTANLRRRPVRTVNLARRSLAQMANENQDVLREMAKSIKDDLSEDDFTKILKHFRDL